MKKLAILVLTAVGLTACEKPITPPPYMGNAPQANSLHYGPQNAPPTNSAMQTGFSATRTYQPNDQVEVPNTAATGLNYGTE